VAAGSPYAPEYPESTSTQSFALGGSISRLWPVAEISCVAAIHFLCSEIESRLDRVWSFALTRVNVLYVGVWRTFYSRNIGFKLLRN
jgi:hypothetical protein